MTTYTKNLRIASVDMTIQWMPAKSRRANFILDAAARRLTVPVTDNARRNFRVLMDGVAIAYATLTRADDLTDDELVEWIERLDAEQREVMR